MFEYFVKWMRLSYSNKIYELNEFISGISPQGREKLKNFLNYSSRMIRNSLLLNHNIEKAVNVSGREKDFIEKFRNQINNNNAPEISKMLDEAQYHIDRNANPQFTFMDLSMKIKKLLKG